MSTDFTRFSRIPTLPTVAVEALKLVQDPNNTNEELVKVIRTDPAIVSRLLKAANSSRFAVRGEVTDLHRAVLLMGRSTAAALVLSFSLAQQSFESAALRLTYEKFWLRSFVMATAAETLAEYFDSPAFRSECYTVGILAGLGKLALLRAEPERYPECIQRAERDGIPLIRAEQESFGFHHAKLSSILLQQMGLPERCHLAIRSIGATGNVSFPDSGGFPLTELTRTADAVASLLCDAIPGIAIVQLEEALSTARLPKSVTAAQILQRVRERVEQNAALFQIDPTRLPAPGDILQEALEQLARLAMSGTESAAPMPTELIEENGRLKRRVADLLHVSRMDALTGLCNRAFLMQMLMEQAALHRVRGLSLGLAVIDLDHFKRINDTRGHQAGDTTLRIVAEALRSALRESDLVGRYGGEEFVAILPDANLPGLSVVGERLRSMVEKTIVIHEGQQIPVTASVGLSLGRCQGNETEFCSQLFAAGDAAMYRAKNSGRNCFCVEPVLEEASCEFATPHSTIGTLATY